MQLAGTPNPGHSPNAILTANISNNFKTTK
nr:MAG TPA: hypothetical protein [Caudoviricetes sp.]DAR19126.1 MAG TPA: hypothetical protein [Caudoviricetes sp.]